MSKKTISLSLLCLCLSFSLAMVPTPVAAAPTPIPSPSPTATPAPTAAATPSASPAETTQNLKDRIERVVLEKKQAIRGAIDRMGAQKNGFIGEIQRISEETITVRTNKGIRILAITGPDVVILKNKQPIELSKVAVGDWVIAMGLLEGNDTFNLRRLIVSSETLRPRDYQMELGSIKTITTKNISFSSRLTPENTQDLKLVAATRFENSKGENITLKVIEADMEALVIYYTNDTDQKIISVIRILSALES